MIFLPDIFNTLSIQQCPKGENITRILASAQNAVDPESVVNQHLTQQGNQLFIDGQVFPLKNYRNIYIVGAGKAALPMFFATFELLKPFKSQGVIITKQGYAQTTRDLMLFPELRVIEAGHPIPDQYGVSGTREIINLLQSTTIDDLVICLISGGGSALLTSPASGISLTDLQRLTQSLLASGASINEINIIRKHLDYIKGGGLARIASPAQVVTLILSDVIGDPIDLIASGPTAPDTSTYQDALKVLNHYNLIQNTSTSIINHLIRGVKGEIPETPSTTDPIFKGVMNIIIGGNEKAAQAALHEARRQGFNSHLLTTALQGEARIVGRILAALLRQFIIYREANIHPVCLILGGETTVNLKGDGLGGRNQEIALSAAIDMEGMKNVLLVTQATDGGDGPTDAAGAVATGYTATIAKQLGLDPFDYLNRNDAYHFFMKLGDLVKTGPTQTNVNDIALLFAY